jgi:hypothetical protein
MYLRTYHYEHAFALNWNAMKGYHYLMRAWPTCSTPWRASPATSRPSTPSLACAPPSPSSANPVPHPGWIPSACAPSSASLSSSSSNNPRPSPGQHNCRQATTVRPCAVPLQARSRALIMPVALPLRTSSGRISASLPSIFRLCPCPASGRDRSCFSAVPNGLVFPQERHA